MVSRRNFFTITVLMLIIFFLCMFSVNMKDALNEYTINPYAQAAGGRLTQSGVYVPGTAEPGGSRPRVVLVGAGTGTLRDVVWEWAAYSKRSMEAFGSLEAYRQAAGQEDAPEFLVIDSATVDWTEADGVRFLAEQAERGTNLVFPSLPSASVLARSKPARELLGIRGIEAEETTAAGLHLYSGFLLGGETVYLPREEEKTQGEERALLFPGDTDAAGWPTFPWYRLASGTKVYMKGIPEDESVETEDYPPLIWRRSCGTAYVFAVNGGYMEGSGGLGILSAMAAQAHPYELYPVLNAQNMVFTGFPSLAEENSEELERLYARTLPQMLQEILWPNAWLIMDRYQYRISCMMTPQLDYRDNALPNGEAIVYYLKTFREQGTEMGLSGLDMSGLAVEEKLREDEAFLQEAAGGFEFSSFYAGGLSGAALEAALGEDVLASVRTVVTDYEEGGARVVGLLSERVTAQTALNTGLDYTYRGDFLVRCLETALGYLNISYDMARVAYPEDSGDAWEKLTQDFGITVSRYANAFGGFESTTVSECDLRIRNFLALDYQEERREDTIRLRVTGGEGTAWFVLRVHNEAVKEVEGGTWRLLEPGAYLIGAEQEEVTVRLGPESERYYHP